MTFTQDDIAANQADFFNAIASQDDRWVVGCGGSEVPCLRNGRWGLYVFNPATSEHGWLDYGTDIVTVE